MKRSLMQNKAYHGIVVKEATEHYRANIGDLVRDVLLSVKASPTEEFVHEMFKMLFNNGQSTTKLHRREKDADTEDDAFEVYVKKIRHHHFHEHQHRISEPNEPPLNEGE